MYDTSQLVAEAKWRNDGFNSVFLTRPLVGCDIPTIQTHEVHPRESTLITQRRAGRKEGRLTAIMCLLQHAQDSGLGNALDARLSAPPGEAGTEDATN